jgi:hypothetical protein
MSVSRGYINDGDLVGLVSSCKYLRGTATMPGPQGLKASLPGHLDRAVQMLDGLMPEAEPFNGHMAPSKSVLPKGNVRKLTSGRQGGSLDTRGKRLSRPIPRTSGHASLKKGSNTPATRVSG